MGRHGTATGGTTTWVTKRLVSPAAAKGGCQVTVIVATPFASTATVPLPPGKPEAVAIPTRVF
ncbi:MAG: hypothetical protein ACRECQ_09390, partial [Burkholderiaceae bacterium]